MKIFRELCQVDVRVEDMVSVWFICLRHLGIAAIG